MEHVLPLCLTLVFDSEVGPDPPALLIPLKLLIGSHKQSFLSETPTPFELRDVNEDSTG
jgi:hypothetical protein